MTDVVFNASAATSFNTSLGTNTTVNSLNFNAASAGTVSGGGYALTLIGGAGGINGAANVGISSSSVSSPLIAAPLALGGPQSWVTSGSGTLTVSGSVVNNGYLLTTLAGSGGAVNISGALTGSGGLAAWATAPRTSPESIPTRAIPRSPPARWRSAAGASWAAAPTPEPSPTAAPWS